MPRIPKEKWNTRLGVILAVAGSAVGLGNFLRFPSLVAEYGGGAFMLAYAICFLMVGLPVCWAEWSMGRMGGKLGFNSCPAIFAVITRHRSMRWVGMIGVLVPVTIYMYYMYVEAWCLGYAANFLAGNLHFETVAEAGEWWQTFIGMEANGAAFGFGFQQVGLFLLIVFLINFYLIYRGVAKGIELFCKYAMPTLAILAFVILIRVLTLPANAEDPEKNAYNGLGFMWNPTKVYLVSTQPGDDGVSETVRMEKVGQAAQAQAHETVKNNKEERARLVTDLAAARHGSSEHQMLESQLAVLPQMSVETVGILQQLQNGRLWLAAAGQIFFSLSIGFGVIITYASYMRENDDVVLSGLAATSANEFCEVGLGGLITIPAAVTFLGTAGLAGMGTFGLGFNVLPMVFSAMPGGHLFGALFFFLLFLAAVTSTLSMLQPGIAFIEEALMVNRHVSVIILAIITAIGCGFVFYFSQDLKALDTIDFWVTNLLMVVFAFIQIVIFAWVVGIDKSYAEANRGAAFPIPRFFRVFFLYLTPAFLLVIFLAWLIFSCFGLGPGGMDYHITDLIGTAEQGPNPVALASVGLIICVALLCGLAMRYSLLFKNMLTTRKEKLS